VYARRGYRYSPTIVIGMNVFSDHLFLRPRYHHYYFGDYYAANYSSGGFYASFSFESRHYGYDPIFAHERWEHRQDHGWEHHVETTYQYRHDHEDARPPRTWAAQRSISASVKSKDNSVEVATSFDQVSKRKDGPMRFQPVAKEEKQQLVQRGPEVQKTRDERRALEARAVEPSNAKSGKQFESSTAKLPKSPIVAKSSDQLGKERAPPSPHKTPQPDPNVRSKPEASTPEPKVNKDNRQSEPPKPEYKEKPVPSKPDSKPEAEQPAKREVKPQTEQPAKREAKPEAEQPVKHEATPQPEQPSKHESKQAPEPSSREKQGGNDSGGKHNDNKDDGQQPSSGK
jgi:hypothetical protein